MCTFTCYFFALLDWVPVDLLGLRGFPILHSAARRSLRYQRFHQNKKNSCHLPMSTGDVIFQYFLTTGWYPHCPPQSRSWSIVPWIDLLPNLEKFKASSISGLCVCCGEFPQEQEITGSLYDSGHNQPSSIRYLELQRQAASSLLPMCNLICILWSLNPHP